jgi:hypothetical protein
MWSLGGVEDVFDSERGEAPVLFRGFIAKI